MTTNPYEPPANLEEPAQSAPAMDCRECGRPMEFGYFSSTGIFWRQRNQQALPLSSSEALPGTRCRTFQFGATKIGAFRCYDCQIVLFRYGDRMPKV